MTYQIFQFPLPNIKPRFPPVLKQKNPVQKVEEAFRSVSVGRPHTSSRVPTPFIPSPAQTNGYQSAGAPSASACAASAYQPSTSRKTSLIAAPFKSGAKSTVGVPSASACAAAACPPPAHQTSTVSFQKTPYQRQNAHTHFPLSHHSEITSSHSAAHKEKPSALAKPNDNSSSVSPSLPLLLYLQNPISSSLFPFTEVRADNHGINWASMRDLSEGGNAIVYSAQKVNSTATVVIKVHKNKAHYHMQVREAAFMRKLAKKKVRNIVPLLDDFDCYFNEGPHEKPRHVLVFPYQGKSLFDVLNATGRFSLKDIRTVAQVTLLTLCDVHFQGIAHCDLTLDNLLVSEVDRSVRVNDWGNASRIPINAHPGTTLLYAAPELFLKHPTYDTSIDIWALGCILYTLATHEYFTSLPDNNEDPQTLQKTVNRLGLPSYEFVTKGVFSSTYFNLSHDQKRVTPLWKSDPCRLWDVHLTFTLAMKGENVDEISDFIDLMRGFLTYEKRITATQALKHHFFT